MSEFITGEPNNNACIAMFYRLLSLAQAGEDEACREHGAEPSNLAQDYGSWLSFYDQAMDAARLEAAKWALRLAAVAIEDRATLSKVHALDKMLRDREVFPERSEYPSQEIANKIREVLP
jgi:hypothetical protein